MRSFVCAATILLLLVAVRLQAQSCGLDISKDPQEFRCDPETVKADGSTLCHAKFSNVGSGPCIGNWVAVFGLTTPGTVTSAQADHPVLGSCATVGSYTFPIPVGGLTQVSSAGVCQGSGTFNVGESLTFSARISPGSGSPQSVTVPMFVRFTRTAGMGFNQINFALTTGFFVDVCTTTARVAGAVPSGVAYDVAWNTVPTTGGYVIDEATRSDFSDAVSSTVSSTSREFQHSVSSATTYYYRVKPVSCGGNAGTFGPTTQTTVLPQQVPESRSFDLIVPVGTTAQVSQNVRFTVTSGASFTATTDKPYLTVSPASGTVGSDGSVTVTVRGDPRNLPVGANTGTVIVTTTTQGKGSATPLDTKTVSSPISISLVTPVTQTPKNAPPTDAIIIPGVAHLEGATARFQSDIRLTNAGTSAVTYQLTFTPQNTDGSTNGRQTTLTVQADKTVALNDVLRDFFAFASPTDAAGGVLEIRATVGSIATTFVSSRTYATTPDGTLGQFVPGIPISKFLKAGGSQLTLVQTAQNDAFRTNLGLFEGLGAAANGRIRVFNPIGQNLGEFPFSLRPFEFQQLGSFLASKGITLPEARIEVLVDSPTGAVSTYASVLDQKTTDPLLVSPVQTSSVSANRYVLPGVADFETVFSNFHSDVRVYNGSATPVTTMLTFYPQGNPSGSTSKTEVVGAGETKVYDNILPTLFGLSATAGSIVVTTAGNSSLIVSGRTYSNSSKGGTFGQFIPAITPAQGIGGGEAPLQILQLEQSKDFRTNIGLTELTGNPATVQIVIIPPDSTTTATTSVDLQANEFRQLSGLIGNLISGNTYNARVTVKVIGGTGRVTAYGSVIDNNTVDPTYVPAQK